MFPIGTHKKDKVRVIIVALLKTIEKEIVSYHKSILQDKVNLSTQKILKTRQKKTVPLQTSTR
jgi:hypothetical protein